MDDEPQGQGGYAHRDALQSVLEHTNLVLYDLKLIDDERHIEILETSNHPILENARLIAGSGVPLIMRIPLVPGFTDGLKYAVVAGAVSGGGLTVIANAPNPAGQAILKDYFEGGVSPAGLLKGALIPTVIVFAMYMLFH